MRFLRILAAVTILSLVAGCHSSKNAESNSASDQSASSSSTITDPCKLLTQEEASAAIGQKLAPGKLSTYLSGSRCSYIGKDFNDVQLDVVDPRAFDTLIQPGTVTVSGIGDKAVWQHSNFSSSLYIKKGGNVVSLGVPSKMPSMTPEIEKAGKLIAGRM